MKVKIVVSITRHYIEGDDINVMLKHGMIDDCSFPIAVGKKSEDLPEIYNNIGGMKIRLESFGNDVEIITKIYDDPNFDSAEAAEDYMNGTDSDEE